MTASHRSRPAFRETVVSVSRQLCPAWSWPHFFLLIAIVLAGCSEKIPDSTPDKTPDKTSNSPSPANVTPPAQPVVASAATPPAAEVIRTMKVPQNFLDNAELTWETPFGPGMFAETQIAPAPLPSSSPSFTTVVGAYFPADENVVVFLGKSEPGLPELDPEELLDGLAVALNSLIQHEAPGVSIDPTPEQVQRGAGAIQEDDLMLVRYPGQGGRTELGRIAFEADRLMKCLSFGRDNITKQPLVCRVPGFLNELERMIKKPGNDRAWHRFWIEPERSTVQVGADGRTLLVDTKLGVQTRYMEAGTDGKLVDAQHAADAAAQDFAQHMTDHYGEFAREFAAFHKLQAFAVMTAIAQTILGMPNQPGDPPSPVSIPFDAHAFVIARRPRETATPETTPATVASLAEKKGRVTQTLRLTGGVDLGAKRDKAPRDWDSATARTVGDAVKERRANPRATRNQDDTLHAGGTNYAVRTVRWGSTVRGSQQDMQVGNVRVVRDLAPAVTQTPFGQHWQLRLPRLAVSTSLAKLESGKEVPREVQFEEPDTPGTVKLNQIGEVELPFDQGKRDAYFGAEQRHRLLLSDSRWQLLSGDVTYRKDDLGKVETVLGPDAREIEFTADPLHLVSSIRTSQGIRRYDYQPGKKSTQLLRRIADGAGNSIEFDYDEQDRIRRLTGNNGQSVRYQYDPYGRLFGLRRNSGETLTYGYLNPPDYPRIVSVGTDPSAPAAQQFTSRFRYTSGVRSELRTPPPAAARLAGRPGEGQVKLLELHPFGKDRDEFELVFDGKPIPTDKPWADLMYLSEAEKDQASAERVADAVVEALGIQSGDRIVVSATEDSLHEWLNRLGRILQTQLPELAVCTTHDPERALAKWNSPPVIAPTVQTIVHDSLKGGRTDAIYQDVTTVVEQFPNGGEDSQIVLMIGHNDRNEQGFYQDLKQSGDAGQLKGKLLILLTCGNDQLSYQVSELLENAGVLGVVHYTNPISQLALSPITSTLLRNLRTAAEAGTENVNWQKLLQSSAEDAAREVKDGAWDPPPETPDAKKGGDRPQAPPIEEVEKLKLFNLQTQRGNAHHARFRTSEPQWSEVSRIPRQTSCTALQGGAYSSIRAFRDRSCSGGVWPTIPSTSSAPTDNHPAEYRGQFGGTSYSQSAASFLVRSSLRWPDPVVSKVRLS